MGRSGHDVPPSVAICGGTTRVCSKVVESAGIWALYGATWYDSRYGAAGTLLIFLKMRRLGKGLYNRCAENRSSSWSFDIFEEAIAYHIVRFTLGKKIK